MKKVLIAITSLYGGGAERVVSVWANELFELGYDISLLLYNRSDNEYSVTEGIPIYTVAENYLEYKQLNYIERLIRMRKIINQIQPDVLINFLPRMQIWMMIASFGIKIYRIETVRVSPWIVCKNNLMEKALWKICFEFANGIIIQTAEQSEFFNKRLQKKCVIIPNPVSEQYYEIIKNEYNEVVRKFVAVGRITQQKNYPLMFRAFSIAYSRYKDIHLYVYGVGSKEYLLELHNLINELGLKDVVTLEGRSNEIPVVLAESDVFLMTSDYEGMPNALVEAMATGLVCISTNCKTGPKDLIDNGKNGFLVDVGNENEVAEAIIKSIEMSKAERIAMGLAAREKIMRLCTKENSRNKLVEVIENNVIYDR